MEEMRLELNNEQRKYLGLAPVEAHWELQQLGEQYLYFDGDSIRKEIRVTENSYFEKELNEKTAENRTILLPKTARGKPKKLNFTATKSFGSVGVYFQYSHDYISISSYDTQTTFHGERLPEKSNLASLQVWLAQWIADSTADDLKAIEAFKTAKRSHHKYQEGDFFAFKVDRRRYGFGRILLDVVKLKKSKGFDQNKNYGLTNLMGRALIVKVYHKISDTLDVDLDELAQTMALPSQAVMDNHFYYGENIIIGHKPIEPSDQDMLISYGMSIRADEIDLVYLQYGLIYKEMRVKQFNQLLYPDDPNIQPDTLKINPFRNEGIGFGLEVRPLEACIKAKSNQPFWEKSWVRDLRNPQCAQEKRAVFQAFGLDADKSYEENLALVE
ncbi:Immunity protein 26 [Acinetobacter marinus]|uniref:Immunity protein 26 n=1 Tax=Acinetobacter marinus TaxID=281375 RepID=A0A1G6HAZ3_9GAMM|nr:immunity 26/phosphotriesterase HocA family protein [Acinetobacter marinus]SDB91105.1 Immunity protein 26 [Acinetobacter marinus]